jgi:cell division protein FtsQ
MARSLVAPAPRRSARRRARPAAVGVPRPLADAARLARAGIAFVGRRRRLRLALLATVIALPLLGGGWLWLRHSSLTAVEHVRVTGVRGADAANVEAALREAARHMSTLDVRPGTLRAAVASWRVVRDLKVSAEFPHGLRIAVSEQLPVAALSVAGARTAVAADGVVLGPDLLSGSLPTVGSTSSAAPLAGQRVREGSLLGELAVLGAAPAPLAKLITRAYMGPRGVTVALRSRLLAYFGDATRPHAKWLALARVLADPSSAGAWYVDVRVPERPAAGFAAGTIPTGAPTGAGPAAQESQSTAAALVAGLSAGSGGGAASGASTSEASANGTATSGASAPAGAANGGEGAGREAAGQEAAGHKEEAAAPHEAGSSPAERASAPAEAATNGANPGG